MNILYNHMVDMVQIWAHEWLQRKLTCLCGISKEKRYKITITNLIFGSGIVMTSL